MSIFKIFKGIGWYFSHRHELNQLKKEVMEVKDSIQHAREDKKVTKAEIRNTIGESIDILEHLIILLDEEPTEDDE